MLVWLTSRGDGPNYSRTGGGSLAEPEPRMVIVGVFPSGGRLPTIIHLIGKGTRGFSPSYIQTESLHVVSF